MGSKNKLATVDAWQQEGVMLGGLSRRVAHPSTFWTSGPPRTAAHQLSTLSTKCLKYVPWMHFIHTSSRLVPMYECATHLGALQWKRMTTKQKGVQKSGLLRSQRYWRLCPKVSGHATRAPEIFSIRALPHIGFGFTHRWFLQGTKIMTWVFTGLGGCWLLNLHFGHPLLSFPSCFPPVINMLTQHLGALYFFFLAVCKTLLNHTSCSLHTFCLTSDFWGKRMY